MADDLASAVTASIQGRGAEFRFGDSPKPEQRTDYEGPDAPQISSAELTTIVQTLAKQLNTADFHRLASALAAKAEQVGKEGPQSLEEAAAKALASRGARS
jgi:hypothetical protein